MNNLITEITENINNINIQNISYIQDEKKLLTELQQIYNIKEIAIKLNISAGTIRRWLLTVDIFCIKIY